MRFMSPAAGAHASAARRSFPRSPCSRRPTRETCPKAAEASMAVSVRFLPAQCPGCGSPVEANYSQYRHARRHPLFLPLLVLLVVGTIGAGLLSLWGTGAATLALTDGLPLRRKERGVLFFAAFAVTLPVIAWLCRLGWRSLHRLGREFAHECPVCKWSGAVRVLDTSTSFEVGGEGQVVELVEFDGIPPHFDPLDAEREKRRAPEWEPEVPPNQDFNFRGQ